jgi:hypothetical protein
MQPIRQFQQRHCSRSHVPMGALRRSVEMLAMVVLADKVKTAEQRYLVFAVVALAVGLGETEWQDYVRSRECAQNDTGHQR